MQEGLSPRMATVLNGIPPTVANLLQIIWQREALSPSTLSFRGNSLTLRRPTRVLHSPSQASTRHVVSPCFATDLNLTRFTSMRKIKASLRTERKEALTTTYKTDESLVQGLYFIWRLSSLTTRHHSSSHVGGRLCSLRQHDT